MALPKLYELITWINGTSPALNEDNLNAMSQAIDDIDDRVIDLAGTIMEDVPQIIEDMAILGPAVENIDENVARAEAAAESAEQYAEEVAPPIEVVKDFAPIITIEDAINKAAKDVKVKVEAVQDLHGYTKPWVGGAGKNKLQNTASSTTTSGVTFTVSSDGTISCSNTSNDTVYFKIFETTDSTTYSSMFAALIGNSVKLVGCPSSGAASKYELHVEMNSSTISGSQDYGSGATFTMPSFNTKFSVYAVIRSGQNMSGKVFKPMLGLASESSFDYDHFEPYTNICPITGHSEVNVTRAGKNLYIGAPSFDGYSAISNWTKQTETYNGHDVYKKTSAWGGTYKLVYLKEGTYTFSAAVKTSDSGQVGIYASMPGTTTAVMPLAQKVNIATSTSWSKISFTFSVTTAGTVALRVEKQAAGDIYISEYQIEANSTATDFEPYQGHVYTIDLDGTRYGGTLDVDAGTLTLLGVIDEYDGSVDESWTKDGNGLRFYITLSNAVKGDANIRLSVLSNEGVYAASGDDVGTIFAWNDLGRLYYYPPTSVLADVSTFKTWLSSNPLQVLYELATPQTITLTAEEVTLLWAYNTLFADTGDIALTYDASGVLRIANAKLDIDTFKAVVAASSDFADFKTRVAAL